jgi:hypothetical protein
MNEVLCSERSWTYIFLIIIFFDRALEYGGGSKF